MHTGTLTISGEDGGRITVSYSNLGEPFREGARLDLWNDEEELTASVLMKPEDMRALRDKMNEMLGDT
tara:strand:+ start:313 stop:516 length:204 start_codon:yes stop_codon:yes gene_type:complete